MHAARFRSINSSQRISFFLESLSMISAGAVGGACSGAYAGSGLVI